MDLNNVYFIIGTSYAGKSTTVKNLAKRHNGIALEEKGIVKLDFAVRADVHADTEPHFFAAVLRMRAVKAEHRLQRAGALQFAVQYSAG